MIIITLDLEGVLVPEIWQAVAAKTQIDELNRTTRDEPNYDKLMLYRLDILKKHQIKYSDIYDVINSVDVLAGSREFLQALRKDYQVIILSDTFYQFAKPLMIKLDNPTLFCHDLIIENDFITSYKLRLNNQKAAAVKALQALNFKVISAGDSYNDVEMLKSANQGFFLHAPEKITNEFPQFHSFSDYDSLLKNINAAADKLNN